MEGQNPQGGVGNLQASDNVYYSVGSVLASGEQHVTLEISGSHSGHMPFLQAKIELKSSVSCACEIAAFNYSTGQW